MDWEQDILNLFKIIKMDIINQINQILAEWDPLNVGEDISLDEYRSYIPQIKKNMDNMESLVNCLEKLLINDLEVNYDKNNEEHRKSLLIVVRNILNLKS